ncbi:hypothetical protein MIDIC_490035 [Alphaproteobacteria bacterium]
MNSYLYAMSTDQQEFSDANKNPYMFFFIENAITLSRDYYNVGQYYNKVNMHVLNPIDFNPWKILAY